MTTQPASSDTAITMSQMTREQLVMRVQLLDSLLDEPERELVELTEKANSERHEQSKIIEDQSKIIEDLQAKLQAQNAEGSGEVERNTGRLNTPEEFVELKEKVDRLEQERDSWQTWYDEAEAQAQLNWEAWPNNLGNPDDLWQFVVIQNEELLKIKASVGEKLAETVDETSLQSQAATGQHLDELEFELNVVNRQLAKVMSAFEGYKAQVGAEIQLDIEATEIVTKERRKIEKQFRDSFDALEALRTRQEAQEEYRLGRRVGGNDFDTDSTYPELENRKKPDYSPMLAPNDRRRRTLSDDSVVPGIEAAPISNPVTPAVKGEEDGNAFDSFCLKDPVRAARYSTAIALLRGTPPPRPHGGNSVIASMTFGNNGHTALIRQSSNSDFRRRSSFMTDEVDGKGDGGDRDWDEEECDYEAALAEREETFHDSWKGLPNVVRGCEGEAGGEKPPPKAAVNTPTTLPRPDMSDEGLNPSSAQFERQLKRMAWRNDSTIKDHRPAPPGAEDDSDPDLFLKTNPREPFNPPYREPEPITKPKEGNSEFRIPLSKKEARKEKAKAPIVPTTVGDNPTIASGTRPVSSRPSKKDPKQKPTEVSQHILADSGKRVSSGNPIAASQMQAGSLVSLPPTQTVSNAVTAASQLNFGSLVTEPPQKYEPVDNYDEDVATSEASKQLGFDNGDDPIYGDGSGDEATEQELLPTESDNERERREKDRLQRRADRNIGRGPKETRRGRAKTQKQTNRQGATATGIGIAQVNKVPRGEGSWRGQGDLRGGSQRGGRGGAAIPKVTNPGVFDAGKGGGAFGGFTDKPYSGKNAFRGLGDEEA